MTVLDANRPKPRSVLDLRTALDAYWAADSFREFQSAYHEILLFGGKDGYSNFGWRGYVARMLRRAALWFEET